MSTKIIHTFIACLLTFAISFSAASNAMQDNQRLPEIGTTGAAFMSIERERVVGDFYMRQVRSQAPIVHDPVLDSYLNSIGQRLVRNTSGVRYPFNFFWINNKEINAFAFMGGYVGVHTGLIDEARTESELAAVLGHEVAHITQRHMVRRMQEQQRSMPMTIAGIIGSILIGMANPEAGAAGLYATMGMAGQSQINYTRLYEMEADRIGLSTLLAAGFDPRGAPDFFGRLAEKYRYVSKPPEMLMTHPLPESRIADTRARAENMQRVDVPPSLDFALAKTRVQARYIGNTTNSDFESMRSSSNSINQQAGQYGLAIRALDSGNIDLAYKLMQPLLERYPNDPFYIDVQTDILLAQKDYETVLSWLRGKYIQQPTEPVITLNFANAALQAEDTELAEKLLRDFLLKQPDHPLALDLLTQVYERSGKRAAMYETRAEALALRGNFRLAIDQLHTAHNHTDSDLTHKRLNARIDQMRSLEQQIKSLM
ncbi:M48 family metalloprotease [Idiomarina sp. M1R2S28]|uniref:Putative beta-barrel assembly-enhancing protease n=1 Tax=Idiomarina rhizosphaerae TaxID=2961572 RepID=A0A9X2FVV2_9GAMM|nr:M48 family metalloprotease [Idiomarina rhizosphaerae]MCP1340207.1 M48 family metalloprotease [Idiomarina rhizosphaerae]